MTEPSFRGERFFLSNIFPFSPGIRTEIGRVQTVEHAYQALKLSEPAHREIVLLQKTAKDAKRICKGLISDGVPTIKEWEVFKIPIMKGLLVQKFEPNTTLAQQLIQTHPDILVEHNTWGDNFWGISPPHSSNGQNWLGVLLMEVRDQLLSMER